MCKTSSPLSYNKPLPSPPVAQIVNSASPPKAQRTLVDAEAGSPTDEQWPILRPENVLPSKSPAHCADSDLVQRSVSESSSLPRNDASVLKYQITNTLVLDHPVSSSQSTRSIGNERSNQGNFQRTTESCVFNSMNPYAQSFHAVSTNAEVALDSPLAHKQRSSPEVIIPPRVSSKRSSLPLSGVLRETLPSQPSSATLRAAKPGSTTWPVLENATGESITRTGNDEGLCDLRHHLVAEPEPIELASFVEGDIGDYHCGSIDSVSTWELGVDSSSNAESAIQPKSSFRVKRLSWHSAGTGSGPTLKIFEDADALILGREGSVPEVPTLSGQILQRSVHGYPVGNLAENISKQILFKPASTTSSCTSALSTTKTEPVDSKPVRISPIRSMQPPRSPSTLGSSPKSRAASTQDSLEASNEQAGSLSQVEPRGSLEASQDTPILHVRPKNIIHLLVDNHKDDDVCFFHK